MLAIVFTALAAIAGARWLQRRRAPPDAREKLRTRIDVVTTKEAVTLVRALSTPEQNTDALMNRLVRMYTRFPPFDESLQCMSVAQQRLQGTGGEAEMCVSVLYSAMMLAITEAQSDWW